MDVVKLFHVEMHVILVETKNCSSTLGENCVTCPLDCGVGDCGICGDGFCTAVINETCNNCAQDCGVCSCSPPCSANGVCTKGFCDCVGNYTGPQCTDLNQGIISVDYNSSQPEIGVSSSFSTFTTSLKEIQELNPNNQPILSYPLNNVNFTLSTNVTITLTNYGEPPQQSLQYNGILQNGIDLALAIWDFQNSTVINFAGFNHTIFSHTLKVTVSVRNFPFQSIQNKLGLVFQQQQNNNNNKNNNQASGDTPCQTPSSSSQPQQQQHNLGNTVIWLTVTGNNGSSLYITFPQNILLDNITRSAEVISLSPTEVMIITPYFQKSVEVDPNFSIIVDPSFSSNKSPCNSGSNPDGFPVKITVAIVVCVFVFIVVFAIFIRYMVYKKTNIQAPQDDDVDL